MLVSITSTCFYKALSLIIGGHRCLTFSRLADKSYSLYVNRAHADGVLRLLDVAKTSSSPESHRSCSRPSIGQAAGSAVTRGLSFMRNLGCVSTVLFVVRVHVSACVFVCCQYMSCC